VVTCSQCSNDFASGEIESELFDQRSSGDKAQWPVHQPASPILFDILFFVCINHDHPIDCYGSAVVRGGVKTGERTDHTVLRRIFPV
jgi:hypothetical protein